MKITDIKQQVKRENRYSVYVDDKYSFSLSESELLGQGLKVGQQFNKDEFDEVKQTAEADKAYMRALDLLARRQRSIWEMEQYLKKKGYDNNIINKTLNKLSNRQLLDDADFARVWVENRRLLKSVSKRKLQLELQQKRISNKIISNVLAADEANEQDVLVELITKKQRQTRYQDPQKLMAYLMRQGFNYSDVKGSMENN